jgi:uncharacterized membrane protein YjjP (DUF1212 family)
MAVCNSTAFLLTLGSALLAGGEAVNTVDEHLQRVAAAYGVSNVRVCAALTVVLIALT